MSNYDLRRLQLEQLEILKDVDDICRVNNIKYYIIYGTLLGAIRHEGFIPWDDDIDICMFHDDFIKFNNICREKLHKKYFLQNENTDKDYPRMWSKIRKNNTCNMDVKFRNLNIHYGIDIDIFDIIYLSNNFLFRTLQKYSADIYRLMMYEKAHNVLPDSEKRQRDTILYRVLPKCTKEVLKNICKKIAYSTASKKSDYVMDLSEKRIMEANSFGEPKKLKFEDGKFYAPSKAEKLLEEFYGDYMSLPPKEKRIGHGERIVDFNNSYEKYLNI